MAGSTRSRARVAASHRPPSPHSSSTEDGTLPDASVDETSTLVDERGKRSSKPDSDQHNSRDVQRLSRELEPMSLGDYNEQDHKNNNKPFSVDDLNPLGQHVKEASAAMAMLETLGLQNLDITIPRCIVLGQQSSGKSSVIEAISGIKTPRDTGTCTCCPLYITMQPSENPDAGWSAKISLQRDYLPDTRSPTEIESEPPQFFPKWMQAQSSEQINFAETTSQAELERLIRCAQAANLSPREDPASFLRGVPKHKDGNQSKFSPNLVRIDITEPGMPTLNFFDLPGIISQAENEDEEYTVTLVGNMVSEYIRQPGSLILVTCDLGTDIANSTAAALARKHGAIDRCIGVLTKPDLLPRGTPSEDLAKILNGERFKLGHEYFVVKNLDKKEINKGYTHHDARRKERKFFASDPWASHLRRFQPRFGTQNLQMYLSRQLAKQTFESLPEMRDQIERRLAVIDNELKEIPETPSHSAVRTISDVLYSFTGRVRHEMEGEVDHTRWKNIWESVQRAFHDSLEAMKPGMILRGTLDKGLFLASLPGKTVEDSIEVLDSDNEDGSSINARSVETPKKRKREEGTPAPIPFRTPSKSLSRPAITTPSHRASEGRQGGQTPFRRSVFPAQDLAQYRRVFKLDDVRLHLTHHSKSKVPDDIQPKVKEAMMRSAIENWHIPIELLFTTLKKVLTDYMKIIFKESFSQYEGSELHREAWAITKRLMENNMSEQQVTLAADSLKDELEGPYIFFAKQYAREKDNVREAFRQHRVQARFKIMVAEAEQYYQREITQDELNRYQKDAKKQELIVEEPYQVEMDLVADIRAYYNIAARRLHDSICMRVESKFFWRMRHELRKELENNLGIFDLQHGFQTAQRLLAESPEREKRRQELVAMRDALIKGQNCLQELQSKYGGSGTSDDIDMSDGFGNAGTDSMSMEV